MQAPLAGKVAPMIFDEPYQKAGWGCCSGRNGIGTLE